MEEKSRPWIPLEKLPDNIDWPNLPAPLGRPFAVSDAFLHSRHIIPAAYPRASPDAGALKLRPISPAATKSERKANNKAQALALIQGRIDYLNEPGSKKILFNAVDRYVRKGSSGKQSLTLTFAHANGFPKETWGPTLRDLLNAPDGQHIHEVWVFEAVQHGTSQRINAKNLPMICDWRDNTRDLLNLLVNYLPTEIRDDPMPVHLPRVENQESVRRCKEGFLNRKLVAIGHSFGGAATVAAALQIPVLFDSLILVDPIVYPRDLRSGTEIHHDLVAGALGRRDTWETVEDAAKGFRASPFFRTWSSEVLELYIDFGLAPVSEENKSVTLTTPALQEALVFAEACLPFEIFLSIPTLDPKIRLRWVLPDLESPTMAVSGGPTVDKMKVALRSVNTSSVRIENAGHLIPQENPSGLAQDIAKFLRDTDSPLHASNAKL